MKRRVRIEVRSNVSVRESEGARKREREKQIKKKGREDQGTRGRGGGREGQEGMHGNEAQAGRPRFARPAFHQRQGELSGSFSSVSPEGVKGGRERATGHGLTP